MIAKWVFYVVFLCAAINSYSQSSWKQKVNFANTASVVGKVSDKAKKIGDNSTGIIGSAARVVSTTTKVVSKAAKQADAIQNGKKKSTNK